MLEVTHFENRGTLETPFGYVYFTDATRMGYAPGAILGNARNDGLFPGNWGGNTVEHIKLAIQFLEITSE